MASSIYAEHGSYLKCIVHERIQAFEFAYCTFHFLFPFQANRRKNRGNNPVHSGRNLYSLILGLRAFSPARGEHYARPGVTDSDYAVYQYNRNDLWE
jgi:hypothetical protein